MFNRCGKVLFSILLIALFASSNTAQESALVHEFVYDTIVYDIDFSPDGQFLASASCEDGHEGHVAACEGGLLRLWNLESQELVREFHGHNYAANYVQFTPNGETLVSYSCLEYLNMGGGVVRCGSSEIILWDVATGEKLSDFQERRGGITDASLSADGSQLLFGTCIVEGRDCERGNVVILDLATMSEVQRYDFVFFIACVAFHPLEEKALLGTLGQFFSLDFTTGESEILKTYERVIPTISEIVVGRDAPIAMIGDSVGSYLLWDLQTQTVLLEGLISAPFGGTAMTLSPDTRFGFAGDNNFNLTVFDAATGASLQTLSGHSDAIIAIAVDREGRYLATASRDETIRLWELNLPSPD